MDFTVFSRGISVIMEDMQKIVEKKLNVSEEDIGDLSVGQRLRNENLMHLTKREFQRMSETVVGSMLF